MVRPSNNARLTDRLEATLPRQTLTMISPAVLVQMKDLGVLAVVHDVLIDRLDQDRDTFEDASRADHPLLIPGFAPTST